MTPAKAKGYLTRQAEEEPVNYHPRYRNQSEPEKQMTRPEKISRAGYAYCAIQNGSYSF
jgi:hypothetical protein